MFIPLIIILLILYVAFLIYRKVSNTPQRKGLAGEVRVFDKLMKLPDEYHLFHDLLLRTEHGSTQIDHVVVSKYAIFVIEMKNYRGNIFGKDDSQEWKQVIKTKVRYKTFGKTYTYITKNTFYNPIKQSNGHAYHIRRIIDDYPHLPIVSVVVFSDEADLSGVRTNKRVINEHYLLDVIHGYRNVYLNDIDLQIIVNRLLTKDASKEIGKGEHIRNVRRAKHESEKNLRTGICPKCGGNLILRQGRYGNFYGCSNYPNCKFTIK